MNLAMFYDTETTGIPLFSQPSGDPGQPHIVEFAATLVDLDRDASVASVHLVARPDGWEIPEEVTAIHGLTTAQAKLIGIDEALIVQVALDLARLATVRVAHNQQFDARIIRIGLKRFQFGDAIADEWKGMPAECTAVLARKFTALPKNKTPTLAEAYTHFTGLPLGDAHTAKSDTLACAEIYRHAKRALAALAA